MTNDYAHHAVQYAEPDGGMTPERSEVAPLMKRCITAYEGLAAQWRRGMTINAHERLALVHLWESGSMTMSELGERIPLSRAAVTALTDRLERMGYLRRVPDEQDRRRTMLELTARPFEILVPMMAPFAEDMTRVATQFSDDEWDTVLRFMDAVHSTSHEHATRWRRLTDDELHEFVDVSVKAAADLRTS